MSPSHRRAHRPDRAIPRIAIAIAIASGAACSGSQKQSEAPQYANMQWDESSTKESTTAKENRFSALAAGDQFVWRGTVYGIEVGRLAMAVGEPGVRDGREIVVVTSQFESTAAAAVFAKVKSVLTSSVDTQTLQPTYHRREVESGTPYKWVEVTFTPDEYVVDYQSRDEESETKSTQKRNPGVPLFDVNSLLLAARTWNLAPGERITVDIFREILPWTLQIERAQDAAPIKTAIGEYPTLRYDVVGRSLKRDGSIDQDEAPRQYSFWITDDARRLPIAFIAKTDYGDVRMELVQYEKRTAP